jgi:hypothetical protein
LLLLLLSSSFTHEPPLTLCVVVAFQGRAKADVFNVMRATHIDFQFDNVEDITEHECIVKFKASQGAHQPDSYEF